jgi:predicted HTH transcriptional regulator
MEKIFISSVQKEFSQERRAIARYLREDPLLANCLFLTGDIERYGTGTLEMCKRSEAQGLTTPQFTLPDGFKIILWREIGQVTNHDTTHDTVQETDHVAEQVTEQVTEQVAEQVFTTLRQEERLVVVIEGEMKSSEIQAILQLKHRENFRDTYLAPALAQGLVERTVPDKPHSSNQKYRLTAKGRKLKIEVLRDRQ